MKERRALSAQERETSIRIAQRLKDLRKGRNLSHEKLSAVLREQYGVIISRNSLMNYEQTNEYHTAFGNNLGMNVGYLRTLSSFFGVSSDYLLGLSDYRYKQSEEKTVRELGLSEAALNIFSCRYTFHSKEQDRKELTSGLNMLLEETSDTHTLLVALYQFKRCVSLVSSVFDKASDYDFRKAYLHTYTFISPQKSYTLNGFEELKYRRQMLLEHFSDLLDEVSGYARFEKLSENRMNDIRTKEMERANEKQ